MREKIERVTAERILEVSLRLFAAKGFEAVGIRGIAAEAGVTTATLYHYVTNKEELLVKLMERGMTRLLAVARKTLPLFETSEQKLAALVWSHVIVHGVHQLSAIVNDTELRSLSEEHRTAIMDKRDTYEAYWRQTLADGTSQGVFNVEDDKLATFALLEMCTGVARWYSSDGPLSILDIATQYANMALAFVGVDQEERRRLRNVPVYLPKDVQEQLAEILEIDTLSELRNLNCMEGTANNGST